MPLAHLRAWMQERALNKSAEEVTRFLDGLRATSDRDMGLLVAVATVVRVNMETHGVLPEGLFDDEQMPSTETLGILQIRINRVSGQFKRSGNGLDAAGALIWSYSLRCLNVPELRPVGRAIWTELVRGHPHVEDSLKTGETEIGRRYARRVWSEWGMVPVGLEPGGEDL
jgi:hypothetical protein